MWRMNTIKNLILLGWHSTQDQSGNQKTLPQISPQLPMQALIWSELVIIILYDKVCRVLRYTTSSGGKILLVHLSWRFSCSISSNLGLYHTLMCCSVFYTQYCIRLSSTNCIIAPFSPTWSWRCWNTIISLKKWNTIRRSGSHM